MVIRNDRMARLFFLLPHFVFIFVLSLSSQESKAGQKISNSKSSSKESHMLLEKMSVDQILSRATVGKKLKEFLKEASRSSLTSIELSPKMPSTIKPLGENGKATKEWLAWVSQNTFEASLTDLDKALKLVDTHPNGSLYLFDPLVRNEDPMYFWIKVEFEAGQITKVAPRTPAL